MFDYEKAKQLQKQSHVRGMLSKEFFSNEQNQLQKKRRQMKRILDQQVEQRRRIKQKQRLQMQMRQKKQEQQIRKYHLQVVQRDRRVSQNSSNVNNNDNNSKNKQHQQKVFDQKQSRVKQHLTNSLKQRANSKSTLQDIDPGDIPLLPIMAFSDGPYHLNQGGNNYMNNHNNHNNNHNNYNNGHEFDHQNAGNIPLLDLSQQSNFIKNKKKSKVQIKKQKSDRQNNQVNTFAPVSSLKFQQSRNTYSHYQTVSQNHNISIQNRHQRKKTFSDQQNTSLMQNIINNSRVSKTSKNHQQLNMNRSPSNTKRQYNNYQDNNEIPEQIQQIENQNKILKSQLKKNQEAISLLIGAVRSNVKLDKFRIQAEKILRSNQNQSKVINGSIQKKEESPLLLPKLKIKHQSIMHDYLIEAARKARLKNVKNQGIRK